MKVCYKIKHAVQGQ